MHLSLDKVPLSPAFLAFLADITGAQSLSNFPLSDSKVTSGAWLGEGAAQPTSPSVLLCLGAEDSERDRPGLGSRPFCFPYPWTLVQQPERQTLIKVRGNDFISS